MADDPNNESASALAGGGTGTPGGGGSAPAATSAPTSTPAAPSSPAGGAAAASGGPSSDAYKAALSTPSPAVAMAPVKPVSAPTNPVNPTPGIMTAGPGYTLRMGDPPVGQYNDLYQGRMISVAHTPDQIKAYQTKL